MVAQAGLTAVSAEEMRHVAWVVWHAGIRINRIGEISKAVDQAGEATGPAKAAWLNARREEMRSLGAPVAAAEVQLTDLADLAEDVVYAAALAQENGLLPGQLYGTLGLDMPQPFDITAADAIEEATHRLRAWHQAWIELDVGLRAAAEAVKRKTTE